MQAIKIFVFLAMTMTTGCAWFTGSEYRANWADPRPLGSDLILPGHSTKYDAATIQTPLTPEYTGALTLRKALELVFAGNPELIAAGREVTAREAEALQAGLLPNPELEAEVEEFLGGITGDPEDEQDLSGFANAEYGISISQLIELGGKRMKRRRLAATKADLATWDYEARRLQIVTEAQSTFIEVLAAQERVALADRLAGVARKAKGAAADRVEAGKVSPLEESRAQVGLTVQEADLAREREHLTSARRKMAAMWGGREAQFTEAVGDLERIDVPPPGAKILFEKIEQNPDLARWAIEMAQRRSLLELERAQSIPDVNVKVGARYFSETENHSFVLGFSVPIPLFDRNQGNIEAAETRLIQAEDEREATARRLRSQIAEIHGKCMASYAIVQRLRDEALPAVMEVYASTLEGYRFGKFGLITVLDAQGELFALRGNYLGELTDYHKALAELEGLIGESINALHVIAKEAEEDTQGKDMSHE